MALREREGERSCTRPLQSFKIFVENWNVGLQDFFFSWAHAAEPSRNSEDASLRFGMRRPTGDPELETQRQMTQGWDGVITSIALLRGGRSFGAYFLVASLRYALRKH